MGEKPLNSTRQVSSIPRSDGGEWVYPSEQMFFDAMRRKNHSPNSRDMQTVVPIHNAVNERVWAEILMWEQYRSALSEPTLRCFEGRKGTPTLRAVLRGLLGYKPPFDRHDWVVDRVGAPPITYVIDFYTGKSLSDARPAFFLDTRPRLCCFEGFKLRVKRFLFELSDRFR